LDEAGMIAFMKHLSSDSDPVIIKVFLSNEAWEIENAGNWDGVYKSDYVVYYTKDPERRFVIRLSFLRHKWLKP